MNDRELQRLKSDLQGHVDAQTRLEGKETALLERLKKDFDVDSLDDAQAMLKELNADLVTLDKNLQDVLDKLEERDDAADE